MASKLLENTKFSAKNRFIKGHKVLIFLQNYDFSITLNFGEGIVMDNTIFQNHLRVKPLDIWATLTLYQSCVNKSYYVGTQRAAPEKFNTTLSSMIGISADDINIRNPFRKLV